jgi:predicted metal-dependent hydrolase
MYQIIVNEISVEVVRKNIKNLHLTVFPPVGRIRVSVPIRVSDEAVRLAVISRLQWIKRHQLKFSEQKRRIIPKFVSGESHYFFGERYPLNVIFHNRPVHVSLRDKALIELYVRAGSPLSWRQKAMAEWYRKELKNIIPPLIYKWEKIIDIKINEWGIKQMKTKWGTCNIKARRIWLNLELAKKPFRCLEYVIVHEMVHLLERHHNCRFMAHMDKLIPNWRAHKDELNRVPTN